MATPGKTGSALKRSLGQSDLFADFRAATQGVPVLPVVPEAKIEQAERARVEPGVGDKK